MDITFKTDEGKFNYRVAGIIIYNDKLLIMRDGKNSHYYLPGGRVKMNENSKEAITREIKEELGIHCKINHLLYVDENFFIEDGSKVKFHELGFYYLIDIDTSLLPKGESFELKDTDGIIHSFTWKDLSEIKDLYIYPLFLKEGLVSLENTTTHIIENEFL
ncbi:NUDIX hydrolase [Clostridium sp. B9]|uniref:NUDIX hydrolase n=1 Tax=Clostridium sp. B9 TaxID=3423224 RepID=UPI003D2F1271